MPNYNSANIDTINIILTKQVIVRIYISIIINNKRSYKFEKAQGGIYWKEESHEKNIVIY